MLSIVDQNAKEIRSVLENSPEILEQHSNIVNETPQSKFLYHLNTDRWDAPIIVTTTVQLLEILLFKNPEHLRKFHALYDSVIIIDEAQNIPTKYISILNAQMNFLKEYCHTDIILCSATIPTFDCVEHPLHIDKVDIIPEDKMNYYKEVFKRTDFIHLENEMTLPEIATFIEKQCEEVNSFVAIFNTKTEARTVFNAIKSTSTFKYYLTADLCPKHRLTLIEEIKEKLKAGLKVICIATQVIEAGVDVSFECGLRAFAGVDNFIQAGGRVNRSGEFDRVCKMYLADIKQEKLGSLVAIEQAQSSSHIALFNSNDVTANKTITAYYTDFLRNCNLNGSIDADDHRYEVYDLFIGSGKTYNEYAELNHKYKTLYTQKLQTVSDNISIFGDDAISVIVPYEDGIDIINELRSEHAQMDMKYRCELLNKAKPYTVNIYFTKLENLVEVGAIERLFDNAVSVLSSSDFYDSIMGVLTPAEIENRILII